MYTENVKNEAIRLRKDERLSLDAIAKTIGIPLSTISLWVRDFPLTKEEIRQRQVDNAKHLNVLNKKERKPTSKWFVFCNQFIAWSKMEMANLAEAAIIFRFAMLKMPVYSSLFDGDKVDFVIKIGDKLAKIQVRKCRDGTHGLPYISLKCANGRHALKRYDKGDFDFLIGYDLRSDTAYVFNETEVAHLGRAVTITDEAEEAWWKLTS